MELRDLLLGRVRTPGSHWAETRASKEAAELREKARRYLDADGKLDQRDIQRMVALLFLDRAR